MGTSTPFPKIIGLVARSRSGKDTVADHIITMCNDSDHSRHSRHSHPVVKRRLAGPIKDALKILYGFDTHHLETDLKDIKIEEFNCSPRNAMVQLTKTIMDLSGDDFFTKRLYNSRGPSEITIIPDIRYTHDIDHVYKNDGITIKIVRYTKEMIHYNNENNIDNISTDYTIVNNGTLEELYEQVDTILVSLSLIEPK